MQKRVISLSVAFMLVLLSITGRICQIALNNDYKASGAYNSYSIIIDRKYINIYYRDMSLATNNTSSYLALIKPNSKAILEAKQILPSDKYNDAYEALSKGFPATVELYGMPSALPKHFRIFKTYSSSNNCYQLFSPASNGLLRYANKQIGESRMSFSVDANGRFLNGDYGKYVNEGYSSKMGYRVSIDNRIQNITLDACKGMQIGAVIVMKVDDGSIVACVNKPFDSYINKCFSRYSVGSVFKIIVSACALENDINPSYRCNGSITVGDTTYSCQSSRVHGTQNIKQALANSCNCYFVNLALTLGAEKLYSTAKSLGFMDSTSLFEGWSFANAFFPSMSDLSSKGQLALLGFGQGSLLATPLQMCSALCTIANEGKREDVRLILSSVDENGSSKSVKYNSTRCLKPNTCKTLLSYMRYVVTNGTGANAEDSRHRSAGKTATAQTGQFSFGREKMNTWFAGVYPYDSPRYAVVVMTEQGTSGSVDCCPIFRTIVEKL